MKIQALTRKEAKKVVLGESPLHHKIYLTKYSTYRAMTLFAYGSRVSLVQMQAEKAIQLTERVFCFTKERL
jgi:hypothetical protein